MTQPAVSPADDLLALAVTVDDRVVRVRAAGEIDDCSAPRLAAALEDAVAGGACGVAVDLGAVTFFDSSGVQVLAVAHRRAAAAGIRLQVTTSARAVLRPLQLCGLWPLIGGDPAQPGSAHPAT